MLILLRITVYSFELWFYIYVYSKVAYTKKPALSSEHLKWDFTAVTFQLFLLMKNSVLRK